VARQELLWGRLFNLQPIDNRPGCSVPMDPRSTNSNENRLALWGRGFRPAAGLPPGVVQDADAPGENHAHLAFQGCLANSLSSNHNAEICQKLLWGRLLTCGRLIIGPAVLSQRT
jgi:hypothetical protein